MWRLRGMAAWFWGYEMHTHYVAAFAVLCIAGATAGQIASETPSAGPVTAARKPEQINVREAPYGAKGDGAADDTAAFARAVSALNAAGGGALYIPAGTYMLNSATLARMANHAYLITANNVTIKGDGAGRTKIQLTETGECGFLLGRNIDDFQIQDLT
jgi:hypothetical protein